MAPPPQARAEKASRSERRAAEKEQIPTRQTRKAAENPPPPPAVDPAKIAAAKKLGQFYLNRGEYDNAIAEFQRGLELDPQNAELHTLIQRAKKAKEAESRFAQ